MDYLGGDGNGSLWYCDPNAPLTLSTFYTRYSQEQVGLIDVTGLKADIATMVPSAETAPILNYLHWLLKICKEVA